MENMKKLIIENRQFRPFFNADPNNEIVKTILNIFPELYLFKDPEIYKMISPTTKYTEIFDYSFYFHDLGHCCDLFYKDKKERILVNDFGYINKSGQSHNNSSALNECSAVAFSIIIKDMINPDLAWQIISPKNIASVLSSNKYNKDAKEESFYKEIIDSKILEYKDITKNLLHDMFAYVNKEIEKELFEFNNIANL